jgi:hypothetical protein
MKRISQLLGIFYNKIIELESRIEGQEQYSRRTSLRFHNIKVPVDKRGNVKHPVNTDELILNGFTYFLRKDWNDFVENVRASESL